VSEWQPIETAPKDKEIVLYFEAYISSGGHIDLHPMTCVGALYEYPNRKPVAWMPLPEPPSWARQVQRTRKQSARRSVSI
jgi:hypothetical protein